MCEEVEFTDVYLVFKSFVNAISIFFSNLVYHEYKKYLIISNYQDCPTLGPSENRKFLEKGIFFIIDILIYFYKL